MYISYLPLMDVAPSKVGSPHISTRDPRINLHRSGIRNHRTSAYLTCTGMTDQ